VRRGRGAGMGLAALAAAGLVLPALLRAAPLYVVEQLMVNVNSAPDASGERVATLKSGDRVEELERAGDQVHVRLASGREGWVRASYLSAEEPLRVRLAQRDAEVARLNDEVSALKAQARAAPTPAVVATAAGSGAAAAPVVPHALSDEAAATPGALFSSGEERARPAWPWTLAATLIGFGAGFGLGALMLDRHIRRKYGGLRIY
jgi:Bacterial SH3 domain